MEMVYSALLLHSAGKKVDEEGVKKVLEAAGVKPEAARIKALVSSLDGVDIDDAIKQTALAATAAPAAAPAEAPAEKKEEAAEEKKEEEEEKKEMSEEEIAAGLEALFG